MKSEEFEATNIEDTLNHDISEGDTKENDTDNGDLEQILKEENQGYSDDRDYDSEENGDKPSIHDEVMNHDGEHYLC